MVKYEGGALIPKLSVPRDERTPITTQLIIALRELMLSGQLEPGQRLPSSRTFARDQGVSRTTAINVYDQLASEGLIHSRVGSGAYVSEALESEALPMRMSAAFSESEVPRLARLSAEASEQYYPRLSHPQSPRPFITGTPAFDEFPMSLWARIAARYWRRPRNEVMSYPDAAGLMELRKAICSHLRANRGVTCNPEEVFIFNGAQDAFNRIGNTLLDPGEKIWFENPGAIGARNSLITSGAQLVPVGVDPEGLNVKEGMKRAPDFRLAFVTPAHQHPLGVTMSLRRRLELLRAAQEASAWVIEDDYVGEFQYGGHVLPTLKSIDTSGRVIYVGTFSKTMFPALRLGYAVVPPELAGVFQRLAGATMQGAPASLQSITADFIEEGHLATHIRRMRRIYAERQEALVRSVTKLANGVLQVRPTNTGFHTVAALAPDLDEARAVKQAGEAGLALSSVARFAIEPTGHRGVLLGFSAVPPHVTEAGIRKLCEILRKTGGRTHARRGFRPDPPG